MGLFDQFRSENVSHYVLRYREEGSSSWGSPPIKESDFRNPNEIEEPIPKEDVENAAEIQNWPPGHYQLIGRKKNSGFTDSLWTFQIPEDEDDLEADELDPIEQQNQRLAKIERALSEQPARIESPDQARGRVFERIINGEDVDPERVELLTSFLDQWEKSQQSPPSSPDEFAATLMNMHLMEGNAEAAHGLLGQWMEQETGADGLGTSIMELATEADLDLDNSTIKSLAALKFLDDPRSFVREMGAGALEAGAAQGEGQETPAAASADARTSPVAQALAGADATEDAAGDAETDAPGETDDAPDDAGEEIAETVEAEETAPQRAQRTGAELGIVGQADPDADHADQAGDQEADADDREAVATVEDASDREADAGDDADEPDKPHECETCGKAFGTAQQLNGHKSSHSREDRSAVDEELKEIEEQTDREAGEFVNAQDAMADLSQAADGGREAEEEAEE